MSIKPGVMNDVLALESKDRDLVFSRLPILEDDPRPDGTQKKKLKSGDGVHRLRAGNFRIFYTYDDAAVSILQVVRRTDTTYRRNPLEGETLPVGPGGTVPTESATTPATSFDWEAFAKQQQTGTPLPEPLTSDLLTRLKVPETLHPRLQRCMTDDALQDCPGVPPKVVELLVDYLYGDPGTRLEQADFLLTNGVDDLLQFAEGKLSAFLLKLNPEQERITSWAIDTDGPTLVRGGPGTGKSTVALYRVREMLSRLRGNGVEAPRILFTTYTNPLVTFSKQLLTSLLGDDAAQVDVVTADSLVASIAQDTKVVGKNEDKQAANQSIQKARIEGGSTDVERGRSTLKRLGAEYLLEEYEDVILGRGLASKEAYLAADRPGRRVPLQRSQREAVWAGYEAYIHALEVAGLTSWAQRRNVALFKVTLGQGPRYDAVVVDEAQDLDPVTIRMLV
ncbi:MAG: UvrD-helicase domain-containing protein [Actinomycetota bacterium]